MHIKEDTIVMIFNHEFNGKKYYSIGLGKKDKTDKYINGYINCSFKKGIEIPNKTLVKIKKGWLDFYLKDKTTVPYVFILEYEIIESKNVKNDPYSDMAYKIEGNMLPF